MNRHGVASAVLMFAGLSGAAIAGQHEVVITASELQPRVFQATTAEPVTFVNRSGRPVHVEFQGRRDQHHVFRVADRIWARFHSAGPHLYVVHFQGAGEALRGVVEVGHAPAAEGEAAICSGLAVMGNCLEP